MFGSGRFGILLAVYAGSLLVWGAAGGQARPLVPNPETSGRDSGRASTRKPPLPKRCEEHAATRPARKVYLDKVTFIGDSAPSGIGEDKIAALLEKRALESGRNWLGPVGAAAREAWQDQGYFQAVVQLQPQVTSSSATALHVVLRIRVDPGPRYRVDEVHIRATNPGRKLSFPEQTLREMIGLYPGEILDLGKADGGLAKIRRLYASHGYIDFTATPGFQIVNATDRITLAYLLDEGKQYRVGALEILGLDKYLVPVLRAELLPGKVFDWSRVVDFYRSQQPGLAPGVSPEDDEIFRDVKTGKVNLVLDFRACPGSPVRASTRSNY